MGLRLISSVALFAVAVMTGLGANKLHAQSEPNVERVGGYFCNSQEDQIAFLQKRAAGENGIMAADAVNKARGEQSCADYISVEVIALGEETVMENGVVFSVQRYLMLPEKIERWSGNVFGSLKKSSLNPYDI